MSVQYITDVNTDLTPEHTYLLVFDLPAGLPTNISRYLLDSPNFLRLFAEKYASYKDFELLGTTVAQGRGDKGNDQFIAMIRPHGTPLLAAVAPIVAIILIVAAVFLVVTFKHAIDTTIVSVGHSIENIGDAVETLATDVGEGVQKLGEGAGAGLKYALPVIGIAAAILGAVVIFGYARVKA